MKIRLWRCDNDSCGETLATWLSVDMAIAGWACTMEGRTFCHSHKSDNQPPLTDAETTANVRAAVRGETSDVL